MLTMIRFPPFLYIRAQEGEKKKECFACVCVG